MKDGFQTDLLGNLLLKMPLVLVKTIGGLSSIQFHYAFTRFRWIQKQWLSRTYGYSPKMVSVFAVKGCKSVKSYPRVSQILRSCTSSGIIPYIFSFCFSWEAPVWSLPHCFIKKGKESKINPTLPNLLMWPELIRKNVGCGVETWNTMIWIWWCMALQEGSKIWIIMKSGFVEYKNSDYLEHMVIPQKWFRSSIILFHCQINHNKLWL
jgi:hypothetical protein